MLAILCALLVVALGGLIYWMRQGEIKGIPEPPGNYIVGHVLKIGGHFCKTFLKWKQVVGPVFQLRFFNTRVLVFNDKESIAKVCGLLEASGRARNGLFLLAADIIGEGVAFAEGQRWIEQRQLLIKSLKTFGVANPGTERRLQNEIADALKNWEELNGKPFELEGCTTNYIFNALWSVIASERKDPSAISHIAFQHRQAVRMDTFAHKLAGLSVDLAAMFTNAVEEKRLGFQVLAKTGRESAIEHQKSWVKNEPRDAMDMILDKMDTTDDVDSPFYRTNVKNGFALGDTIGATIDTASRTLEWLMLYLAKHPEAERKLHAEIDRVFGDDVESWPNLADREIMPYTQACILEASRKGSVVPFGVPHRALEDFEFNGALIPKGTILVMNMYGAHHDTNVWDRPEEFRPERFLTPEGDKIDSNVKNNVVAFGLGRRICPGYALAMDSMFLYVVNAYRKFRFEIEGDVDNWEGRFGLSLYPPEGVQLRAITRVKNESQLFHA